MNATNNSRDTAQDELIDMWTRGTDRQDVLPPPTRPTNEAPPYEAPVIRPAGRAGTQMLIGFCLFAVGVGITSATYDAASGSDHLWRHPLLPRPDQRPSAIASGCAVDQSACHTDWPSDAHRNV